LVALVPPPPLVDDRLKMSRSGRSWCSGGTPPITRGTFDEPDDADPAPLPGADADAACK